MALWWNKRFVCRERHFVAELRLRPRIFFHQKCLVQAFRFQRCSERWNQWFEEDLGVVLLSLWLNSSELLSFAQYCFRLLHAVSFLSNIEFLDSQIHQVAQFYSFFISNLEKVLKSELHKCQYINFIIHLRQKFTLKFFFKDFVSVSIVVSHVFFTIRSQMFSTNRDITDLESLAVPFSYVITRDSELWMWLIYDNIPFILSSFSHCFPR